MIPQKIWVKSGKIHFTIYLSLFTYYYYYYYYYNDKVWLQIYIYDMCPCAHYTWLTQNAYIFRVIKLSIKPINQNGYVNNKLGPFSYSLLTIIYFELTLVRQSKLIVSNRGGFSFSWWSILLHPNSYCSQRQSASQILKIRRHGDLSKTHFTN